jgi:hypothetical protein
MNLFNKNFLTLFVAMCIASPVWAGSLDVYIKIDDINGESKIVACPGGTCLLEGLAAGDYEVQLSDKDGKPLASHVVLYEEPAPATREAGSGLATGKRQHLPVRMTSKPGDAIRRFGLKIESADVPVTLKIKNVSAVKTETSNQNTNPTKRVTQ